jgi:hypothetical protein
MAVVVAAVLLLLLLSASVLVEAVALVAVLVFLPVTTPATGIHTYSILTPWIRVVLEKLTGL